jgi:hypothetical protein
MLNRLIIILIISVFSIHAPSRTNEDFPSLTRTDLPKAKFTRTRDFNGESLYGYINGGADLYLEYGFSVVRVTELVLKKDKFKVEVWKMTSPEAAFGIFSVSRFRCNERPDFSTYTCLNKYQLQIYKGQYYISIINESGTPQSAENSVAIGKILAGKIGGPSINLTGIFPDVPVETVMNTARLMRGKLGVINGMPELEELFRNAEMYTAITISPPQKTIISIEFMNTESFNKFIELHNRDITKMEETADSKSGGVTFRRTGERSLIIEIYGI